MLRMLALLPVLLVSMLAWPRAAAANEVGVLFYDSSSMTWACSGNCDPALTTCDVPGGTGTCDHVTLTCVLPNNPFQCCVTAADCVPFPGETVMDCLTGSGLPVAGVCQFTTDLWCGTSDGSLLDHLACALSPSGESVTSWDSGDCNRNGIVNGMEATRAAACIAGSPPIPPADGGTTGTPPPSAGGATGTYRGATCAIAARSASASHLAAIASFAAFAAIALRATRRRRARPA